MWVGSGSEVSSELARGHDPRGQVGRKGAARLPLESNQCKVMAPAAGMDHACLGYACLGVMLAPSAEREGVGHACNKAATEAGDALICNTHARHDDHRTCI